MRSRSLLLSMLVAGCGGAPEVAAISAKLASETTAHLSAPGGFDSIDPALAWYVVTWQVEYATCAMLLNYPEGSTELAPDLAAAMPEVSADGREYTFEVRRDFTFSPPSNAPVTAEDVKFSIERAIQFGPAGFVFGDISELTVDGNRLTIVLTAPSFNFLARLSTPFSCVIPRGTAAPGRRDAPIATAGPYYLKEYSPQQKEAVLRKNPNYRGPRAANLDKIVYHFDRDGDEAVSKVLAGERDYLVFVETNVEPLAAQYPSQVFQDPAPGYHYLALNNERPLFSDVKWRKAVNLVLDRTRLAKVFGDLPHDQTLPPGMPGFADVPAYPLASPTPENVEAALTLTGGESRSAELFCIDGPLGRAASEIIKANLKAIHIDVEIHPMGDPDQYYGVITTRGAAFDLAIAGWLADYLDPEGFINLLFDGRKITPEFNTNLSYFNSDYYNAKMDAAAALSGAARYAAYQALDADLTINAAPVAVFGRAVTNSFFSARMGCQVYSPIYSMALNALCIRP
jgi:peptide/nickel transport system substrate-binding protein